MLSQDQIKDTLRNVIDPELRKDIVSLGMVRSIEQPEEGRVDVVVSLTTPGCPIRAHFEKAVAENVRTLGVDRVNVGSTSCPTRRSSRSPSGSAARAASRRARSRRSRTSSA